MPRRSSSQEHRLIEIFKQAEQGKLTPSPAQSDTADSEPTYLSSPVEEKPFNYANWQLEITATRMALPRGSRKTKQGRRVAESIYHHLQKGEELKAHVLSAREYDNQDPPIPSRAAYSERIYRSAVFGPAG